MVTTDSNTVIFIKWLIDSFENCPQKIAVIDCAGKRKTTYEELYVIACRVVAYIRKRQLPAHSFIGICLPTSMEYIAAEIGIWLEGHAIVPMGNEFPVSRIRHIMEHSESPLLINEEVMNEIVSTEPIEPSALLEEDDINALFYTSGSTGKPLGVLHSFRSFGNPLFPDEMFEALGSTVMAVTAPMYFIACKLIYEFLTRGKTVNIVPPEARIDIRKLEDFLVDQHIDFVFIPPSVLHHFHNKSKDLKVVFTASERLSDVRPEGYTLLNHYGQTETAGIGPTFIVDKAYDNTPIGMPIPSFMYSIQDQNGNEVPVGNEGELCYRGDFTPGYYKDPERTARLYRNNWLHSGDIVRQLPDRNLIYVNRKDWLIKVNGHRVEPGEVEMVLQRMEGIGQTVVKGFTAASGRQYLCGYYTSSKSGIGKKEIIDYLSSELPAYMVPAYWVKLDSFPLNMNGKTDRNSLLPPDIKDDTMGRDSYDAPQNDIESKLCFAFEECLGYKKIGVNEDFFLLGGDSIRVMKLQTLCPDLSLTARIIYTYRTPRKIAEALEKETETHLERKNSYPLSQTQLGIFAVCMAKQGEAAYNNGVLFQLGSGVDLVRLAKACDAMIEAHPFVKTRLFIDNEGNPRQRRNDDEPYQQEIEKISDDDFEQLRHLLIQPFFLLSDRLFRIRLFSTPSSAYLFMDFHHVIFDGMSMDILLNDMEKAYRGETIGREVFSGFEVAQEEEELRLTKTYTDAKEWNLQMFGDLEITSLPFPDKSEQPVTFGRQERDLEITEGELKEACRRFNVTPNVFAVTIFGYLLGHYTNSQESLFATIYHGRHDLKLSQTVAMLVKTLPVYMKWNRQTTLRELLQNTKNILLGSMSNDLFSFAELKAANNYISSQVIFAFQGDIGKSDYIGGEQYTQLPLMENATGEPLALEVARHGTKLSLIAEYHSNAYSEAFVNRLMQCYIHSVKTFASVCDDNVPLSHFPLLSTEDMQTLLTMGCGETPNWDLSETFVTKFRHQTSLTPNAIAVVDECSSLTYTELDRQSDALAAALVKAGVVNDSVVALMLPRCKEFLLAILAVFKAGGAYVSLDQDYPQARINFMLNDLDVRYLITTNKLIKGRIGIQNDKRHLIILDQFNFSATASPIDYSRPQSLAYIIYTSGTSGNPKGVMVEHHSLCAMLTWLIQMEGLKTGDKCALHTSFSFDASLPDFFGPLICGAEVHVVSSALRYDLGAFSRYLTENNITGLTMSTQIGMELLESYDLKLRYMFLGGENLHVNRKTPVMVINGYGPTEFTVCSSYHIVNPDRVYDNIPIGRPVPGSSSIIIGPDGDLAPWGALGELCLVGPQLARGYWRREQQTQEKFVECPFIPGERMYRTGDLVQWSMDGELLFHGRIDNQVKLNGFRIELGEIESCINDFPEIKASAVILSKQNNHQFLSGFFVADSTIAPDMLRNSLTGTLPAYMVPLKLIQLDRMPMTPNGKIDRRQLSEFAINSSTATDIVEEPVNQREQVLLDLLKELLGTDTIGMTDDLTLLGLTSLDAIKLATLAENKGFTVKVNDILRLKTIKNIASYKAKMGDWAESYDKTKPVVVIVQGLTPYHQLQPLISTLCLNYSVYVIEPLQEHYLKAFKGKTKKDIVNTYIELIKQNLPTDAQVCAFIGHSYGGEFCYRCAVRWQSETGISAKVILLDTYFYILKVVEKMKQMQDYIIPIEDGTPMPFYNGEVEYFEATQMSHKDLQEDSVKAWCTLLPHIKIHPVSTSHFRLLEKQNIDYSLSQIKI